MVPTRQSGVFGSGDRDSRANGPPARPSQLKQAASLAIALPLLAMTVLCGLLFLEVSLLRREHAAVSQTYHVIGQIDLAQRLLSDQETGIRAFLMTGEETYLEPTTRARAEMPGVLAHLAALTSDNPTQLGRSEELRLRYGDWWSQVEQEKAGVVKERNLPFDASFRARLGNRKSVMDQMRLLTRAMVDEEEGLLSQREASLTKVTLITRWGSVLVAVLLGGILAISTRGSIAKIDGFYRTALVEREQSEALERRARRAAEALAAEIARESEALEQRFTQMRDEHERALARLAKREGGGV
ncbi:MAG: CHASE3 domain-containing protein [Minicystis sp.]